MRIKLSPILLATPLELERAGDVLIINGAAYDFTDLPEGATLPRAAVDCFWLASDVERIDGTLHLTLILPHGGNAPPETLYPAPIIDPPDGPVMLPLHDIPQEAQDDDD